MTLGNIPFIKVNAPNNLGISITKTIAIILEKVRVTVGWHDTTVYARLLSLYTYTCS